MAGGRGLSTVVDGFYLACGDAIVLEAGETTGARRVRRHGCFPVEYNAAGTLKKKRRVSRVFDDFMDSIREATYLFVLTTKEALFDKTWSGLISWSHRSSAGSGNWGSGEAGPRGSRDASLHFTKELETLKLAPSFHLDNSLHRIHFNPPRWSIIPWSHLLSSLPGLHSIPHCHLPSLLLISCRVVPYFFTDWKSSICGPLPWRRVLIWLTLRMQQSSCYVAWLLLESKLSA